MSEAGEESINQYGVRSTGHSPVGGHRSEVEGRRSEVRGTGLGVRGILDELIPLCPPRLNARVESEQRIESDDSIYPAAAKMASLALAWTNTKPGDLTDDDLDVIAEAWLKGWRHYDPKGDIEVDAVKQHLRDVQRSIAKGDSNVWYLMGKCGLDPEVEHMFRRSPRVATLARACLTLQQITEQRDNAALARFNETGEGYTSEDVEDAGSFPLSGRYAAQLMNRWLPDGQEDGAAGRRAIRCLEDAELIRLVKRGQKRVKKKGDQPAQAGRASRYCWIGPRTGEAPF